MNSFPTQSWIFAAVMLVAGLGIPIMAAMNSGLGVKLHSPAQASVVLFAVGLVTSFAYLLLFEGLPKSLPDSSVPFYFYLGGLFVVLYVLSISWVAPRFGIGNAVSFVLVGQLISMAAIDHFSLLGAAHHPLSIQRFLGLICMTVGVFLAVRR